MNGRLASGATGASLYTDSPAGGAEVYTDALGTKWLLALSDGLNVRLYWTGVPVKPPAGVVRNGSPYGFSFEDGYPYKGDVIDAIDGAAANWAAIMSVIPPSVSRPNDNGWLWLVVLGLIVWEADKR